MSFTGLCYRPVSLFLLLLFWVYILCVWPLAEVEDANIKGRVGEAMKISWVSRYGSFQFIGLL